MRKFILVIFMFMVSCTTLQRTFSQDGLTTEERIQRENEEAEARAREIENFKIKLATCINDEAKKKKTDFYIREVCVPPDKKGVSNRPLAPLYMWYDAEEPFYVFFTKEGNFVTTEIDEETIHRRNIERQNLELSIRMQQAENAQKWMSITNSMNQINNQNQIDQIKQNQQSIQFQNQQLINNKSYNPYRINSQ